eukprot:gene8049-10905_t
MHQALSIFIILCAVPIPIVGKEKENCVKWGNTFEIPLTSVSVRRDCDLPDGRAICCAAIHHNGTSRGVGINYEPLIGTNPTNIKSDQKREQKTKCSIHKEYFSSPLELQDLEYSKYLEKNFGKTVEYNVDNNEKKISALFDYLYSSGYITNSTKWLDRVQQHMSSEQIPSDHQDDWLFLSRFQYTRICGTEIDRWNEWIEPITLSARHPFSFANCKNLAKVSKNKNIKVKASRSNVDYVLLQSGMSLYDQTHSSTGKRFYSNQIINNGIPTNLNNNNNNNNQNKLFEKRKINNHYLFDAGTSTFDSSLLWFTCGYSQRKISFDQVYGWEMTLLEPTNYWKLVPSLWKPYWHFHNIPITSGLNDPDSPLKYISQIATPQDFVSFKLDIDHPDSEMPIALSILQNDDFSSLIDEFFFELHFRCEVMTSCGWGKRVPIESHGLLLDRPTVLQFFIDLRRKGIRAHIWP